LRHYSHNNQWLLFFLLTTLFLSACAEIRVVTIPPPTASPRLRVYVEPFTTFAVGRNGRSAWDTTHEEFVNNQVRFIEEYLAKTGIYEIIKKDEVVASIGDVRLTYARMEMDDWQLTKKIGLALHADYVMIIERGTHSVSSENYYKSILVNVATGKKFGIQHSTDKKGVRGQRKEIVQAAYKEIFRSAKEDLLTTAINKGQRISAPTEKAAVPPPAESPVKQEEGPQLVVSSAQPVVPPAISKPLPATETKLQVDPQQTWIREKDIEEILTKDGPITSAKRLVVYDLDAPEHYKPASLILSEALREEIFKSKKFTLVNREDLEVVLKEVALQQTGLLNENEAVQTGKGLAANQVVTGRLGLLGKTFVLQAKRVDVETYATLGLASAKFNQGHEDEAFNKMQEFATHLAGQ
jgi:hypothetical protein